MKPVNLSQLLFHTPSRSLSFFFAAPNQQDVAADFETYFESVAEDLESRDEFVLLELFRSQKAVCLRTVKRHPKKTCGFFLCHDFKGFILLDLHIESYFQIGPNFHVRPLLEETYVNQEFILINVSFYDIRVYRGDFQHMEVMDQYDFESFQQAPGYLSPRFFAPQYMGMIPYKTILALRTLSRRITEKYLYESVPVIVTGLSDTRAIFLQDFEHSFGVISHLEEDFYEKTCVEILHKCRNFRNIVADYYSAQLKERLKRMNKSPRLLSDLEEIVKATSEGRVVHLVLPTDRKVWGTVNFETGDFELHKRIHKRDPSMDILNELAEEVIRQGGKIQILSPHFFPFEAHALAILKGSHR